jgi:hypothetical protein
MLKMLFVLVSFGLGSVAVIKTMEWMNAATSIVSAATH